MGLVTSKLEPIGDEISKTRKDPLPAARGQATKRRGTNSGTSSVLRPLRPRFEECFGLDESQSRSTESTQGSPDTDVYPSRASKDSRRPSQGSSGTPLGRPRWLRRQASGIPPPQTNEMKKSPKADALPPSFLVFPHLEGPEDSSTPSMDSPTAPVPVKPQPPASRFLMESTVDNDWNRPGDNEGRMDELQRMYDLRTWDMYLRITEARKNKPAIATPGGGGAASAMIPHSRRPTAGEVSNDYDYYTPADEVSLNDHDNVEVPQSSEDMIFGDLE